MYFQGILALKYNGRKRKKFSINDYYRNNNFNEFIKEYPVILATTHSISKSQGILALKYNGRKRKKFSINDYYRNNNFNEFIKEYPVILATTHSISKS